MRKQSAEVPGIEYKSFPFEMKAGSPDGSTFEGLVSVFHNLDSWGDIVDATAFDADLAEFMADGFIGGLNHDWDNPIGRPQDGTKIVPRGLFLRANVIDTAHGMDVRKLLAEKVVRKLSIGYATLGFKMLETSEEVDAYWQSVGYEPTPKDLSRATRGNVRLLTRVKLYEGSPVTVPANDLATITAVKAAGFKAIVAERDAASESDEPGRPIDLKDVETERDAEAALRDAGVGRQSAKAFVSHLKAILTPSQRDAEADEQAALTASTETEPEETKEQRDAEPTPDPLTEPTPAPQIVPSVEPAGEKPLIFTPGGRVVSNV